MSPHRLAFSGSCSEDEFLRACDGHDFWYHSFYFDNDYAVRGDYDIGRDIEDYGFPADMSGLRVLDVGTGSGWFSVFFAQRGAAVTAVDLRGWVDFDWFGRAHPTPIETEKPTPDAYGDDGRAIYYSPVSAGFAVMTDLLNLKIPLFNSTAYDLDLSRLRADEPFDLVFMGALLLHLRDPIGALMAAHRVCRGEVVVTTTIEDIDESTPRACLPYLHLGKLGWWVPNRAGFRAWFEAAGLIPIDLESTVTLTSDRLVPFPDVDQGWRNNSQVLQLGRARVADPPWQTPKLR